MTTCGFASQHLRKWQPAKTGGPAGLVLIPKDFACKRFFDNILRRRYGYLGDLTAIDSRICPDRYQKQI
jgi:hypothetical protein